MANPIKLRFVPKKIYRIDSPEVREISPETLANVGIEALMTAGRSVRMLGEFGRRVVSLPYKHNGDTPIMADYYAEKDMIDSLVKGKIFAHIVSEEQEDGTQIVNSPFSNGIIPTIYLDGLDGSSEWIRKRFSGRSVSMFGAALGDTYDDLVFGGMYDHNTNEIHYATSEGYTVIKIGETGEILSEDKTRKTSGKGLTEGGQIPNDTKIRMNTLFDVNYPNTPVFGFEQFLTIDLMNPPFTGSTGRHYAELATGEVDVVVEPFRIKEVTGKEDLELAASFPLLKKSGAFVSALLPDGSTVNVGSQNIRTFGQGKDDRILLVAATSAELGSAMIKEINNARELQRISPLKAA